MPMASSNGCANNQNAGLGNQRRGGDDARESVIKDHLNHGGPLSIALLNGCATNQNTGIGNQRRGEDDG